MASLAASAIAAPSSQRIAQGPAARHGSASSSVRRAAAVTRAAAEGPIVLQRPIIASAQRPIAAPAQGPIIIDGQVLAQGCRPAGRPCLRHARAAAGAAASPALPLLAAPGRSCGRRRRRAQVLHSVTREQMDVINGMGAYVEREVLPLLKPTAKCWQPQDFLPPPESPDFLDQVRVQGMQGRGWGGEGGRLLIQQRSELS